MREAKAKRRCGEGAASPGRLAVRVPFGELLDDLPPLDPDDYPDRDSLIRDLVALSGWPADRVGRIFGISAARVRQIAGPSKGRPVVALPGEAPGLVRRTAPTLSIEEARAMMNDYLRCPYTSPAEVRAAREWIEGRGGSVPRTLGKASTARCKA